MSNIDGAAKPLYVVTGQTQRIIPGAGGVGMNGWRIQATTRSGVAFGLDVPDADYTVNKIAALLTDQATKIEAVHALEGT